MNKDESFSLVDRKSGMKYGTDVSSKEASTSDEDQISTFSSRLQQVQYNAYVTVSIVFLIIITDFMAHAAVTLTAPKILLAFENENTTTYIYFPNSTLPDIPPSLQDRSKTNSWKLGIIFATKHGVSIFMILVASYVPNIFGHKCPILLGLLTNIISMVIAILTSKWWHFVIVRLFQTFGASFSLVSGQALIAERFQDESTRAIALSFVNNGYAGGEGIGFLLSSYLYQFYGQQSPFTVMLVISAIIFVLSVFLVDNRAGKYNKESHVSVSVFFKQVGKMLLDKHISIPLGCSLIREILTGCHYTVAIEWLILKFNAQQWQIGTIFGVSTIANFVFLWLTGFIISKYKVYRTCFLLSMSFAFLSFLIYTMCTNVWMIFIPEIMIRISQALVTGSVLPYLTVISDMRYSNNYKAVAGLANMTIHLGLTLGGLAGGAAVFYFGIQPVYVTMGALAFLYGLSTVFLESPD